MEMGMKKTAIIQVRTASTRLPQKCLLQINGKTILEHIVERLKFSNQLDEICIATTENSEDDILELIAEKLDIKIYRGDSNDVLDRFYKASLMMGSDIICRVTADDPFKDPVILDHFMTDFLAGEYDYLSNTIEATYPEGIDIEIFRFQALEKAWKEAELQSEREHVTPYIWKNPNLFNIFCKKNAEDLSSYRWTMDKPQDFVFIQQIYDRLYNPQKVFLMNDILAVLKKEPWLMDINCGIPRNEGYLKSIENESNNG